MNNCALSYACTNLSVSEQDSVECIKMKDLRGVDRGACNNCGECADFIEKVRCDYCDCAAAKHVTLSKTNFCENSSPAKRLLFKD